MHLLKNIVIVTLGTGLFQIMQGVGLVVATRFISPEDIGLFSLYMGFHAIIALITGSGLRQIVALEYFHRRFQQQKILVQTVMWAYFFTALPMLGLFVLFYPLLNACLFVGRATFGAFTLTLFMTATTFFSELAIQLITYNRKVFVLVMYRLISGLILCLGMLAMIHASWGISGLLMSYCLATLPLCIYALCELSPKNNILSRITDNTSLDHIKKSFIFLPSLLATWVLQIANRWFIAFYAGLDIVALYAVTDIAFTAFNACVLMPLGSAYIPAFLHQFALTDDNHKDIDDRNKKIMWRVMALCFLGITIGMLLAPYGLMLLPIHYHAALHLIYMRLIGALFLAGSYFSTIYIHFKKRISFLVLSLTVTAGFNLYSSWLFSRWYGAFGTTMALTLSYALYFVSTIIYNSYLHKKNAIDEYKEKLPCAAPHTPTL